MQLFRLLPAREPVLVDLILDLVRRVGHVYTRVQVRRAHLGLWALQCGEELGVDEGGFRVFELDGNVSRQTEVRVLVDSTGDEARDIGACTEDMWEGVREGRGCLDRAEVNLADVIAENMGKIREYIAEINSLTSR